MPCHIMPPKKHGIAGYRWGEDQQGNRTADGKAAMASDSAA